MNSVVDAGSLPPGREKTDGATGWVGGAEREVEKKPSNGYLEAGDNFIDTSDTYQVGQSEELVGDFIAADRDNLAVALRNNLLESRWQLARDLFAFVCVIKKLSRVRKEFIKE